MEQKEWVSQLLWYADICFSFTVLGYKQFVELSFHVIMLNQSASTMRFFLMNHLSKTTNFKFYFV